MLAFGVLSEKIFYFKSVLTAPSHHWQFYMKKLNTVMLRIPSESTNSTSHLDNCIAPSSSPHSTASWRYARNLRPKESWSNSSERLYCTVRLYFCKKNGGVPGLGTRSFQKNALAFFPILYKRTECFLRSFPFFIKEQNDHCVLSRSL